MSKKRRFTLAAVQHAPIYWDREASTDRACDLVEEAAGLGANLVCFGEGWLPGYPFFAHYMGSADADSAALVYVKNATEIPSPTTDRLCRSARTHKVDVVIGIGELDSRTRGSIYCTLLFIGSDGSILGRHRKLKLSYRERLIWADGDGDGLRVYERSYARISGLNCWEHQMVLPGYALMAQGTQVHVAAWPGWDPEVGDGAEGLDESMYPRMRLLSRAFASQASSYVVAVGGLWWTQDVQEAYRHLISRPRTGDSMIIDPTGTVIAGPLHDEVGILIGEGSLDAVAAAKLQVDVAGHYSRPDIFRFGFGGDDAAGSGR